MLEAEPTSRECALDGGLWERQVAAWNLLGPPLRPSPADVTHYGTSVLHWSRQHGPPRALILGATPELAALNWPPRSEVLAVDRSRAMIQHIWPGYPTSGLGGACGDWSALPLPDRSRDLVFGDGPFTQLDYPHGYQTVLQSIHRVLSNAGFATIRFFIKPDKLESPEQVFADLYERRIKSFHSLKWRLAMALQKDVYAGIQLRTIWDYWADAVEPSEIAHRLDWSPAVIATMQNYRGLNTRYTFPTLKELYEVLSPAFTQTHCHIPQYELGNRCPILTLKPVFGLPWPNGHTNQPSHR